eukprot:Awhi_evm1s531
MGQLGFDSDGRPFPTRVPCLANFPFVQAECGAMHTAFLRDNGQQSDMVVSQVGQREVVSQYHLLFVIYEKSLIVPLKNDKFNSPFDRILG